MWPFDLTGHCHQPLQQNLKLMFAVSIDDCWVLMCEIIIPFLCTEQLQLCWCPGLNSFYNI